MIFVSSLQQSNVCFFSFSRQFSRNLMTFEWFWLSYREREVNEGRETARQQYYEIVELSAFCSCPVIILSKLNDGRNKFHITH